MKKKLENKLEKLNGKKIKYGSLKNILGGAPTGPAEPSFGTGMCGGTGTADDPYQIETFTVIRGGGSDFDGCD